jgi:hypothetical protein
MSPEMWSRSCWREFAARGIFAVWFEGKSKPRHECRGCLRLWVEEDYRGLPPPLLLMVMENVLLGNDSLPTASTAVTKYE